jgi:hypothetical protein
MLGTKIYQIDFWGPAQPPSKHPWRKMHCLVTIIMSLCMSRYSILYTSQILWQVQLSGKDNIWHIDFGSKLHLYIYTCLLIQPLFHPLTTGMLDIGDDPVLCSNSLVIKHGETIHHLYINIWINKISGKSADHQWRKSSTRDSGESLNWWLSSHVGICQGGYYPIFIAVTIPSQWMQFIFH